MNLKAQDQCKIQFDNMKFRKTDTKFITFKVDKEEIVVQNVGSKDETWESFLNSLPANEYRFAVFDFHFKNTDGMSISKLVFISWNPDASPLKRRVLYATAKESFKNLLGLNTRDLALSSISDMNYQEVIKQISK